MRTVVSAFFFVVVASTAVGQQFILANFGGGMNPAPVFDAAGNLVPAPSPYVADLFWSANTNALMDSLTPTGHNTPFVTSLPGPGYFFGGTVTLFSPTSDIVGQVRVWDTTYGPTYHEARDNGGEFGFSNLIPIHLMGGGPPPNPLFGLQSFQLQRLPRLDIRLTPSNTLLFTWRTNLTRYVLQHNRGFQPGNWKTVTNAPTVIGPEYQITLPGPEEPLFYRLISQ